METFTLQSPKSEDERKGDERSPDVDRVWATYLAHWQRELGKGGVPKLTPKRGGQIQARLREGYAVEQIERAIAGLFASDFHRGQNERGTRYLEIEQITRAGERIEKFEAMATKTTPIVRPRAAPIVQGRAPAEIRQRWSSR